MTERNERGQTTVTSTAAATILPDAPVEKSQWRITHYFAIDSPSRRAYPPPRFRLPCGNNSSAPSSFSSARVSFFPSALPAAPFPNLDQWRRPPLEGGIRERGHAAVPRGLLRVHKGHPSFGETQSSTETNRVVNHPPRCFLAPGFSLAFPPALPPLFSPRSAQSSLRILDSAVARLAHPVLFPQELQNSRARRWRALAGRKGGRRGI
jgi:hypothetical protein